MPITFTVQTTPPPALTKLQIAEHQLERAILLFLDEKDFVSAVTLAGAAEEILGVMIDMLEDAKVVPTFRAWKELAMAVGQFAPEDTQASKEFAAMANYFRNGLKHYSDGEDIEVIPEAAIEMIDRALSNFVKLTGRETPNMTRYMVEVHGS